LESGSDIPVRARPPDAARAITAVIACISVYGISIGLTTPLISLRLEELGHDRLIIGVMASMPALATLLASPFVPRLIFISRPRDFLLLCLLFDLVAFIGLALWQSLSAWFLLRFLLGVSSTAIFVACETWINELAEEHRRGRVIGVYNATFGGSLALGPVVIAVTGIHGYAAFVVGGSCIALAAIPLGWLRFEDRRGANLAHASLWLMMRELPLAAAAILLAASLEFSLLALLPVWGVRVGLPLAHAAALLGAFGIGRVVFQLPIGWLADRVSRAQLLSVVIGSTGIAAALLPLASAHPALLWLLVSLWGGAMGAIYALGLVLTGQRFRGLELAAANATIGMLWGIGSILAPPLVGFAMDAIDPHGFVLATASLCAIVLFVVRLRGWAAR
jgi:MFS family permease